MTRCIGNFKAQSTEVEKITYWRWRWRRWWLIMLLVFASRSEMHCLLEVEEAEVAIHFVSVRRA
jgi:hypothetical protein